MNYDGFKLFINAYLGNDISDKLCQHLFSTFCKQVPINNATITSLQQAEAIIADKPGINVYILLTTGLKYLEWWVAMQHIYR